MAAQSYSVKSDAQLLLLLEIGTTSGFFLFAYKRGTGEDKPRGKALPAPQLAPGSVIWTALVVAASCMAHSAFHFSGNERFAQMRALHRFAIDDLTVGTPLLSKLTHICCVSL